MEKKIDTYKDYRSGQYIHYREKVVRYEEQEVRGKQKKRIVPVKEAYQIPFNEIKELRLDNNGSPVPTLDTEDFTIVSNYLLDFWGAIMGTEPVMTYLHLRRHAYGKKDYCFPDIESIAMKMKRSRGIINGYLDTLEEYGFAYKILRRDTADNNRKVSPLFKIRRFIPMLTKEMYDNLPAKLRRKHDLFMDQYESLGFTEMFDKGQLVIDDLMAGARKLKNKKQQQADEEHKERLELEGKQVEFILSRMNEVQRRINESFHTRMQEMVSKPSYDTWFKSSIYLTVDDQSHILLIGNNFAKDWVQKQYINPIRQFMEEEFVGEPEISYELMDIFIDETILSRD